MPAFSEQRDGAVAVLTWDRQDVRNALDPSTLLALASASRALLGSVARDARDQARHIRGTRRDRKESRPVAEQAPPAPPARKKPRFRFKRRWVVVPVVTTVLIFLILAVGAAIAIAAFFG